MSVQRRLALSLMDHAAAVMPADRKDWAEAMRAEFAVMPTDRDALAWAGGCIWASYRERIQPMQVFLKSLIRALAVWLVILGFATFVTMTTPWTQRSQALWNTARMLSVCYGGILVTLLICELMIARFWLAQENIFQKSLARTVAVWLWNLGFAIFHVSRILMDPSAYIYLGNALRSWAVDLPVMFVAIFVPLLICELLIARVWRVRPKLPA